MEPMAARANNDQSLNAARVSLMPTEGNDDDIDEHSND